MFTLLVILIVLICILLSLVVLAQAAKGQGLAGGLAAPGGIGTVFGVRRASDFLVKATITLAASLMVLALLANLFFVPAAEGPTRSAVQSGPAPVPTAPAPAVPQSSAPAVPSTPAP
jgi:preprotein translocase subunit SecG